MEVPENLVEAVDRLKPRAILLLDTSAIMSDPRLTSYQIAASGRFLLLVPLAVDNELIKNSKDRNKEKRRRASQGLKTLGELFTRGDPTKGIELGDGRWMITAHALDSPVPNSVSIEERQDHRNLGPADAAL